MSSPLSARFLNKAKSLKVEDSSLRILQRENLTEAQLSRMTESDLSRLGLKKTQIVAILKAARSARVGVLDIRTDVQPRGIAGSPSKRNRGDYLRNRVQSLNEVVLNMQKENELYREILNRAWGNQGRERVVNAFKLLFSLEKKQNNVDKKSNSGEQVQHASSLITAVKDLVTNLSTIPVNSHGRQQSGLRASATSYMTPVDRAQDMLSLCLQGAQRVAHGLSDEGAFNFGGEFSLFAALATGHFYAQKKAEAKKSDNRLEVNEEDFVRQLRTFLKDQSRINTLGRDFLSLFVTKYLILEMKEKKETKKFSDKESMKSCLAIAQMKSTESSFQRLISRLSKFLGTRVVIRSAEGLKEYGSNENRDCITISKSSFPNSNYSLLLFSNKPLQASSNAVSRYPVTPIASPNMGLTINEMASLHLPPTQANYNFPDFWDQNSDSLPGGSIIPSFEKPVLGRDRTRTKEKKTSVEDDRRGTSSPVLPAKLPALYARGSTGRRTSEHSTTSVGPKELTDSLYEHKDNHTSFTALFQKEPEQEKEPSPVESAKIITLTSLDVPTKLKVNVIFLDFPEEVRASAYTEMSDRPVSTLIQCIANDLGRSVHHLNVETIRGQRLLPDSNMLVGQIPEVEGTPTLTARCI